MNGLDNKKSPFLYLDDFIQEPHWEQLHTEVCLGIAHSDWNKRFVSSGVHPDYSHLEITPYIRDLQQNLDGGALAAYKTLQDTDQRLKFVTAWGPRPHPFWVIYIRDNIRRERTGIFNKSVGADCRWTENSKHFSSLVQFIESMPFSEIGRVILFMTEAHNPTVAHFDARERWERPHDDFVWFTTKPHTKHMFVLDEDSRVKHRPLSHKKFIWFNEMDYHGTDPVDHFSFSIRVDGVFDPQVRQQLLSSL